jgi:hypothetical protein
VNTASSANAAVRTCKIPLHTPIFANRVPAASGSTSNKDDEFLKLTPAMGQPSTIDSSTDTKTNTTGGSSIPIIPLTPDAATSSSGQTNATPSTGITDKAGVTDKIWKPTELDEVKQSGAPGAGPAAPDYKAATPDLSSTTTEPKLSEPAKDANASTKQSGLETSHSDTAQVQPPVGGPIEEILNKGTSSKDEHTVPEKEAEDPHSKMSDKTTRATHAHKTDVGEVESMQRLSNTCRQ